MNYKRGESITDFKKQVKVGDVIYIDILILIKIKAIFEKMIVYNILSSGKEEYYIFGVDSDAREIDYGGWFYFAIPDCETCPDNKTIDYTCSACQEKTEKLEKKKPSWFWCKEFCDSYIQENKCKYDICKYEKKKVKKYLWAVNEEGDCWYIRGHYSFDEINERFGKLVFSKIENTMIEVDE